ncbi:MAG: hypothetical protein K7J46_20195 [Bryobacter sp.]|nr:hypothetical protein [Bryobacter sp. CoA8 C33]
MSTLGKCLAIAGTPQSRRANFKRSSQSTLYSIRLPWFHPDEWSDFLDRPPEVFHDVEDALAIFGKFFVGIAFKTSVDFLSAVDQDHVSQKPVVIVIEMAPKLIHRLEHLFGLKSLLGVTPVL